MNVDWSLAELLTDHIICLFCITSENQLSAINLRRRAILFNLEHVSLYLRFNLYVALLKKIENKYKRYLSELESQGTRTWMKYEFKKCSKPAKLCKFRSRGF